MDNISFVFPGQGSQKLGMLSDLAESFPVIKSTFQEASEVIGEDLWEVIQTDSKGILSKTEITQPVLLTASVAIWRAWTALTEVKPDVLAGHSLGEYSAFVCSDALSFEEAVKLVHFRGCAMQNA
jgi:(acyl-carrier-protein) S-malonyltransferase